MALSFLGTIMESTSSNTLIELYQLVTKMKLEYCPPSGVVCLLDLSLAKKFELSFLCEIKRRQIFLIHLTSSLLHKRSVQLSLTMVQFLQPLDHKNHKNHKIASHDKSSIFSDHRYGHINWNFSVKWSERPSHSTRHTQINVEIDIDIDSVLNNIVELGTIMIIVVIGWPMLASLLDIVGVWGGAHFSFLE